MLDCVAASISRYNMFAPSQRVAVAVSAGKDSVCLLHVLVELAPRWNLSLSVIHLNHGLRGAASDGDAKFVAELAASLGLPFFAESSDVRLLDKNIEQAGRRARQRFYRKILEQGLADRVAVGHTRSDQAETVLSRLLRGSGTAGLSGIRPVRSDGIVRPLIECDPEEIRAYLARRGLSWREDASNQDRCFARNRIRQELLPRLTREYNPALTRSLARLAALSLEDEAYWTARVDEAAAQVLLVQGPAVLMPVEKLNGLPVALRRRVIRRACQMVRGDLRGLDFHHVQMIVDLAEKTSGAGRVRFPGAEVCRSFASLRIAPSLPEPLPRREYKIPLASGGLYPIPGTVSAVELQTYQASELATLEWGYNTNVTILDGDRAGTPLYLRNWRPGDRLVGLDSVDIKIKCLFQQRRVPRWDRDGWPVIESGNRIIWVRGFGLAEDCLPTKETRRFLRILDIGNIGAV